jgi:hypothetical protein
MRIRRPKITAYSQRWTIILGPKMGNCCDRWLITEDTDLCQQGTRKYVLRYLECTTFDETICRSSTTKCQLLLTELQKEPKIHAQQIYFQTAPWICTFVITLTVTAHSDRSLKSFDRWRFTLRQELKFYSVLVLTKIQSLYNSPPLPQDSLDFHSFIYLQKYFQHVSVYNRQSSGKLGVMKSKNSEGFNIY